MQKGAEGRRGRRKFVSGNFGNWKFEKREGRGFSREFRENLFGKVFCIGKWSVWELIFEGFGNLAGVCWEEEIGGWELWKFEWKFWKYLFGEEVALRKLEKLIWKFWKLELREGEVWKYLWLKTNLEILEFRIKGENLFGNYSRTDRCCFKNIRASLNRLRGKNWIKYNPYPFIKK